MKMKLRIFSVIVLTGLMVSCVTGQYMGMRSSEQAGLVGTVQTTFYVNGSFRYRKAINQQAYISLLGEAQNKFPDDIVDVRDISWAIGPMDLANNYEYSAIGKVIRLVNK